MVKLVRVIDARSKAHSPPPRLSPPLHKVEDNEKDDDDDDDEVIVDLVSSQKVLPDDKGSALTTVDSEKLRQLTSTL